MSKDKPRIIAYILIGLLSVSIVITSVLWLLDSSQKTDAIVDRETASASEFLNDEEKISPDEDESFTSDSESDVVDSNETQQEAFALTYPREEDSEYFTPISEDYLYVIKTHTTGSVSGNYYEDDTLYSFNENGEVIQYVSRCVDPYYLQDDFSIEEYWGKECAPYHVVFGDVSYCDMLKEIEVLDGGYSHMSAAEPFYTDKALIMQDNYYEVVRTYYSMKEEHLLKSFENTYSADDYLILKYHTPINDDYVLTYWESTPDQYLDSRIRQETLYCYDELGYCNDYCGLVVFQSTEDAKKAYDSSSEEYKKKSELHDNVIVELVSWRDGRSEEIPQSRKEKLYPNEADYFSKPGLSFSQFEESIKLMWNSW